MNRRMAICHDGRNEVTGPFFVMVLSARRRFIHPSPQGSTAITALIPCTVAQRATVNTGPFQKLPEQHMGRVWRTPYLLRVVV